MKIDDALNQLSEIHEQLAKAEVFRGYRAGPVLASGVLSLLAAFLQPRLAGIEATPNFVVYWLVVSALTAAMVAVGVIHNYVARTSRPLRRRTLTVVGQFAPMLAAGALFTAAFASVGRPGVALLPGTWAVLTCLGYFASRPYLPRMMGWVGLFYLAAGAVLLLLAPGADSVRPWGMGLTYGIGQIFAGFVLYWNLERNHGK